MNDIVYRIVTWLDNLTRRQVVIGAAAVVAVIGLIGGAYHLGTQQATDTTQQADAPTINDSKEAENTTKDVQKDLRNVSQELEDVENLF